MWPPLSRNVASYYGPKWSVDFGEKWSVGLF